MKELIESIKDFKIVPNNFKSAGAFELVDVNDDKITANLVLLDDSDALDYEPNSNVEVFGVNNVGLVYFETKILSRNDKKIELATTQDFSIIQRREYSRVDFKQGSVTFKDMNSDFVLKIEDISAGGMKLISKAPLETDRYYAIEIALSNNMKIECELKPIRVTKTDYEGTDAYTISGKFVNLENVDRIVLVQYAFKVKMEEQNKDND